ncbi:NUDIX domain-containing protein [Altererythrobacter soli]|uniref:8-oxo-dGTP diphosphatase n=1 Tax=Croceibacterium soli TaxID=1739690 RepID=A0A6I4UUB6_9SPHN|nr:(deoxy)nucleoside triphosphate pyrophosphohydrolase [Croceibacterium soli]MXP41339.1 NUDIX domain-containing protein [Croceibacterium soli]
MAVVAAAIRDSEGRVLLQERLPGKHHAGLWEFPGGKVEPSENPRFALRREVEEELGVGLDEEAMAPAGFADREAGGGEPAIVLFLYECPGWEGDPEGREGQRWGWFTWAEAAALPLPPMDRTLLESLAPKGIAKPETPPYVAPSKRARSSAG